MHGPPVTAQGGSSRQGCLNDAPKCDVIFQLNYRIGDGDLQTFWEQREVYDGNFTHTHKNNFPFFISVDQNRT